MSEEKQQKQEKQKTEEKPERVRPTFQTEHVISRGETPNAMFNIEKRGDRK